MSKGRIIFLGSIMAVLVAVILITLGFLADNRVFYASGIGFILVGVVGFLVGAWRGYQSLLTRTATLLARQSEHCRRSEQGFSRVGSQLGEFEKISSQVAELEKESSRVSSRLGELEKVSSQAAGQLGKLDESLKEIGSHSLEKVDEHRLRDLQTKFEQFNPRDSGDKAIITFSYDDGRRNNYEVALPLHEEHGIPASFSIIANRATDPFHWKQHMNPREIVEASCRGVEITSHGVMHREKFTEMDNESLDYELKESKKILDGFLPKDRSVKTLCIPFSASSDIVLGKASKIYSVIRGFGRRLNDPLSDDPYVASYALKNTTTFSEIKTIIDSAVAEQKWVVLMLHGVVEEETARRTFDITDSLLKKVLSYVDELGRDKIQPANFSDVVNLRQDNELKKFYAPNISKSGAYTLAESDGFLITYHKNSKPSEKVGISFGGLPSKKTPTGFGSSFILKQGFDHIFVAQRAGSQYQELSVQDFVKAVKPYIQGKIVFTYGSSLGAYAALYYGGAIDAAIISSAPKNSAHPYMRKKQFSHIKFRHETELGDVPKSRHQPIVLFDPHRAEDKKFINNWVKPAYPDANLLEFPYAGHTVLNTMQKSGVLKRFITTYLDSGEIVRVKLKQEGSYIWHAEKGRKLWSESRIQDAKNQFQRSLQLGHNSEAAAGLVRVYLKECRPDLAREVVDTHFEKTGAYRGIPLGLRKRIEESLGPKDKQ